MVMNELALFAGAGGGILGGKLLGWRTVCAVEWEPYPASVLCARQNDGLLETFPIWDDVQTFDGKPWAGIVDVVSGGFPCQDISAAGGGAGIDGERSGMWREMARIICEVGPQFVFVENSPMLTSRGLGVVLGDLAKMGFDAKWGVLGAADIGANHQRDRIWIVGKQMGNTHDNGQIASKICKSTAQRSDSSSTWKKQASQLEGSSEQYAELADSNNNGHNYKKPRELFASTEQAKTRENANKTSRHNLLADSTQHRTQSESCEARKSSEWSYSSSIGDSRWWSIEPNVGRVAYGLADRMDRLKAIGNGQVPLCAATAWRLLNDQ
jgi:DNA (cytosine-5)-methyltransferase 1